MKKIRVKRLVTLYLCAALLYILFGVTLHILGS